MGSEPYILHDGASLGIDGMPRQGRIDFPGVLHHVIVRGVARGRIVDHDAARKAFVAGPA